jgi:hypothetical protein
MPAGVTVELSVDERTVELPRVEVTTTQVTIDGPGRLLGGSVSLGRFQVDLGTLSLGSTSETISVPDITFESLNLPSSVSIPVVTFSPGRLGTQRVSIPTPFGEFALTVIDPFGTRFPDLDVGFRSVGFPGFTSFPVPTFGTETVTLSLGTIDLPRIDQSLGEVSLPEIRLDRLAVFPRPEVTVETSTLSVLDPSTLQLDVAVETDTLADRLLPDGTQAFFRDTESAVLEALTDATGVATDLFTDTEAFVFETVFDALESRVTEQVAARITGVIEGFLQLLLEDDTKQDLRERRREE